MASPKRRGSQVKVPSSVVTKVQEFVERERITASGIVVAVSGGPDSVALLNALLSLRGHCPEETRDAQPFKLVIAHLNHKLRGPESDADESFVKNLYASLIEQGVRNLELRCNAIEV